MGLHGLHGTYDDAVTWLSAPENRTRPTAVLSMGSSIGNFSRIEAAEFLGRFAKLMTPSDVMIIGLDGCKDPNKVYRAYNDSEGITRRFYENGLAHANEVLGYEAFKPSEWEIVTHFDAVTGQHQAFYSPTKDVTIDGVALPKGEKLVFEEATKYGPEERDQLWRAAGLIQGSELANKSDDYRKFISPPSPAVLEPRSGVVLQVICKNAWHKLSVMHCPVISMHGYTDFYDSLTDIHVLSSAALDLPTQPSQYAAHTIPSLGDYQSLWTAWDTVTKSMIPREDLLSKPIKLRNALIFYLGHIPTFSGK